MHSIKHIISVQFIVLFILIVFYSETAHARSVYVITDSYSTVKAYDIQGDQIEEQKTAENLANHGGAVGLALDPDSEMLFVTYEGSNIIEMVNAKTMISEENPVTVDGASSLAGIAFDQTNQKLYVVQREYYKLFVYLWNPIDKTLILEGGTYKILADLPSPYAYGIALDEYKERLYVSNATSTVHYYDTNSWNHVNSVNVNRVAVGIAVDPNRHYLYTGSWSGTSGDHTFLARTDISDINNPTFDEYDVGAYVIGLTTDEQTGLVYITDKSDEIKIFNTATFPSDPCEYADPYFNQLRDIIVRGDVSYKPSAFYLEKIDVNEACVLPGDYITYKISYGPNGVDHNNVVITDYLPCQVDYENIFDPNYDDVNHTYKWQIGSLSASAPNDFVTLTVIVNLGVEPNGIITNYCEIESDNYCSFASADTNVCFWSPDIIYVDVNAVGCNSGLSWYHADPDLQSALQKAQAWSVNQIWVAEGTYKPTKGSVRSISFELLDDVAVYGGFPPGGGTWFERNPGTYETILSGDIGTPNDLSDNSYHVVKCEDVNNAILDGFTITGGNANGSGDNAYGGGIYCEDSNDLSVTNCTFRENSAMTGGGMYNEQSSPALINCTFKDNTVHYLYYPYFTYGGGICNYQSSPTIINCTFNGNSATTTGGSSYGGAICNWDYSSPNISNCTFSNNSAREGGAVYNYDHSDPNIINCVFNGNTVDSSDSTYGGGICNYQSSPTLINCTFSGNSATTTEQDSSSYGGAMCNWNYSNPNISNCTFSNNSADYGGAVYNYDHSDPNIINCVFNGNTADYYGGGMVDSNESSPTIINCTFSGNSTTVTGEYSHGGAMCNWIDSDANITNCTFSNNSAREGGAVYNYYSDPNIINCIFSGNTADVNGGGIYNYNSSSSMISNCTFSNNSADYGGAVCNYYSDPNIINCIFSGNTAVFFGGGMGNLNESSPTITNCIFSGNYTGGYGGGGIGNAFQSPATINNCTFSGNYAYGDYGGGGMCNWESSPMVTNCIFWADVADSNGNEIYNYGNSNPDFSYCDIEDSNGSGGWDLNLGTDGGGNIDEDPCFFDVEEPNGSWTEDASYDSSTFQSTLTDAYAYWSVNELAGKFVSPNTPQLLQFFIVSNDVNTINVWSDVESIAHYGDPYQIYDYHLKLDSACIDAGDPDGDYTGQTDIDGEPRVFDGDANETEIVDMGADEYYWSPADFNSDGFVNFFDYAFFASAWLTDPNNQYYNEICDLVDNNYIDSNDLARFCEDWLWQTAWAKAFPCAYDEGLGRSMSMSMGESFALTEDLLPSKQAEQAQPELTAADIEEIIKWLEELWLTDDEVRKVINEDEWLEFMEAVIQALKEQMQN